jgi:transposase
VCPGNHESAGKRKRGKTTPGNRYVRTVLGEIAWAATRTPSQFKSKFQGLVIRRGTKRAIIALAHKVLKTVFVLLSRQVPYHDSTVRLPGSQGPTQCAALDQAAEEIRLPA